MDASPKTTDENPSISSPPEPQTVADSIASEINMSVPSSNRKNIVKLTYFLSTVIALLIILVVGSSYIIYSQQRELQSVRTTSLPKITPAITKVAPPISPARDITSSWETYHHEQMHFSIKYPSSVMIDRNESNALWFTRKIDKDTDFRLRDLQFTIYLQNQSVEEVKRNSCSDTCKEFTINNLHGFSFSPDYGGIYYIFETSDKDRFIEVHFQKYHSISASDEQIFKNMILSMKST